MDRLYLPSVMLRPADKPYLNASNHLDEKDVAKERQKSEKPTRPKPARFRY